MKTGSLLLVTVLCASVSGYNILCLFPAPSKSHLYLGKGIVDALLEGGHQVTLVTPFPLKSTNKNLKQIETSEKRSIDELMEIKDAMNTPQVSVSMVRQFAMTISTAVATSEAVREALVKEKYDAVVTEWFFSDMDAGYAAVQQAPWIVLSTVVMHPYIEYMMDSVRSLPVVPFMMKDLPMPMTLWQRMQNTFAFAMMYFAVWQDRSRSESAYKEHFSPLAAARGVSLPPFADALYNISIMFVNSHPSFAPAFSLPPNVVEIAGYHIAEDTPPLPKDLQEILNSSTNGVVFFSLGSIVKSTGMPEKTKKDLVKVFGELPYTILWKFEEEMNGLPKNVHIRPWMPQVSILAHPNTKAFITHGGLLSTLEALRYGVPIVATPVFGDQPGNADRSVQAGHAIKVKYSPDMAQDLKPAVIEILTNDSYYKKAKDISKLFNNRPVKEKKLVSYYVELAIESKGAYHLRSNSRLYKWYELWMLDQALVILGVLFISYATLKRLVGLFIKKTPKDSKRIIEKKKE